jgi:excisionase family DNA binding protein
VAAVEERAEYDLQVGRDRRLSGYLTVRETADVLNMHFMSVYKMVQSGRLPALKIGSRWKIDQEELRTWMAKHHQGRSSWLLVGAGDATARHFEALLGPGCDFRRAGFDNLCPALDEAPDVVLIDTTRDTQTALAALALARTGEPPPLAVLLVGRPVPPAVMQALEHGVVVMMPIPAFPGYLEQIGDLLRCR